MTENETAEVWVLKGTDEVRAEAPRRGKSLYDKRTLRWIECISDFAGNSYQPGCWSDLWRDQYGHNYVSVGGFWEHYTHPPRCRVRRLRRYASFRRIPTGTRVPGEDGLDAMLRREWGPENTVLPPKDTWFTPSRLDGLVSPHALISKRGKPEGTLIPEGALFRPLVRAELELLRKHCTQESDVARFGALSVTAVYRQWLPTRYRVEENGRLKFETTNGDVWHRLFLNRVRKQGLA